jgi:hypothetical protein
VSLKDWANQPTRVDITLDIVLALILFGLTIPVLAGRKLLSTSPTNKAILSNASATPNVSKTAAAFVALRRAIIGQESGGRYYLVNPDSGAMGLGQLMPDNVREWGKQVLGRSPSKQEFLAHPGIQLKIINYKLREYWQDAQKVSGGNEDIAVRMVASRWYSRRANFYNSSATQYSNGRQYPSIAEYTLSVLKKYRIERDIAAIQKVHE